MTRTDVRTKPTMKILKIIASLNEWDLNNPHSAKIKIPTVSEKQVTASFIYLTAFTTLTASLIVYLAEIHDR